MPPSWSNSLHCPQSKPTDTELSGPKPADSSEVCDKQCQQSDSDLIQKQSRNMEHVFWNMVLDQEINGVSWRWKSKEILDEDFFSTSKIYLSTLFVYFNF